MIIVAEEMGISSASIRNSFGEISTQCICIIMTMYYICNTQNKKNNMAQTTMTFRVDDSLKKDFDKLCDEFGLTNTAALTVFMKTVVRERRIPFEIRTVSESETRSRALEAFERMRADAAKSGLQGMSLDEINAIIREVRDGR
jgi:addiction module RelB/DinJ family antitoxin